jgi:hypothetical protein
MAKTRRPVTPTRKWQTLVPELPPFADSDEPDEYAKAADTAERLLLLLHYAIDWQTSWVADHRKTYWDKELPSHVHAAANCNDTLDGWWSDVSRRLVARAPRQPDRRLELAVLLREPSEPVLGVLLDKLPALILRVSIIAEAVASTREQNPT